MHTLRIIAALIPLLLCSCARWYSYGSNQPALPAETSFNKEAGRGDHLFLKLNSGQGEDWLFMLDSGSPVTVLDKSLEPKLGRRIGTKTILYGWYGKRTVGIYACPDLFLGGTKLLTGNTVFVDDFAKSFGTNSQIRHGILGTDCLRHYCFQLDFAAGKLRFLPSGQLGEQELGRPFALFLSRGDLTIRETLMETADAQIKVDTGDNGDGALGTRGFRRAVDKQDYILMRQWRVAGRPLEREAQFREGLFGGERYTDLILTEYPRAREKNLIGLRFLARHLVTFDFPNRKLYLKKNSSGPIPKEEKKADKTGL
jgi:hypothetical protein